MSWTVPVVLAANFMLNLACESEEESSDDDEEIILTAVIVKKKYKRKPARVQNYLDTVSNYSAKQFQQHFRITIDTYETLLNVIGPQLERKNNRGRNTINVETQILSVLWLLATPDSYRSVGDRFDLGKSSLSVSFMRVVKVLCDLAPRIIKWPSGEQIEETKTKFRNMAGLPNVIGCVDGTYVEIKAPKEDAESYITRKSNYAITLQGTCDAELKLTDVFVGFPGSVHDNRIFRNSDIYLNVQNHIREYFPEDEYIIGDKAYPILSWCIPPYVNRGNMTPQKRHFNSILSKTRQTIERTFALLFGRFRRLKFLDMNRTDCIPATVLAACVLHNICLDGSDLEVENYIQEGLNHVQQNDVVEPENEVGEPEGRDKRDRLCRLLFQQHQ